MEQKCTSQEGKTRRDTLPDFAIAPIQLDMALGHLDYELRTLYQSAALIGFAGKENVIANVVLESFLVHARCLIEFFYCPLPFDTDVGAADFCESGNASNWNRGKIPSAFLADTKHRADVKLAHVSLLRDNESGRGWEAGRICAEIQAVANQWLGEVSREWSSRVAAIPRLAEVL